MWAYGASRVLDYMKQYRTDVDTDKVAIIGHSRLGKTALWCGAQDERFAAVISNNSGYGGAASSKHGGGERVADFIRVGSFDWFCENFKLFRDEREDSKPYDQSFLLALIAPRYLLVGSAVDDKGADPESEFLTTLHASAAWELLGRDGLITPDRMPKPGDRFGEGNIQYHLRAHGHFLSREDWGAYIKFLDEKFKGEKQ
jgi:pimeloyl-ACP methyl ester carboxylesterase